MAKNITRLENMIENVQHQQIRNMANLGELAKEILELKRQITEAELDIYDLKKGTEFEAGQPKDIT